jgi:signal transduction histidine kinase
MSASRIIKAPFNLDTIRSRLLISFVLIALLPAIAISVGSILVGYQNGRQQALNQLESAAETRDLKVQAWIQELKNEMVVPVSEEFGFERASIVLGLASDNKFYHFYSGGMRNRLRLFVSQSSNFSTLSLVDLQGRIILSTASELEGSSIGHSDVGALALTAGSLRIVESIPTSTHSQLIVLLPIIEPDGKVLGAIVGQTNLDALENILIDHTGLGNSGKAYLVNRNYKIVAPASVSARNPNTNLSDPGQMRTLAIAAAVDRHIKGLGEYEDFRGVPVVGSYQWLPDLQMALLVEQDMTEVYRAILSMLNVNVGIAFLAILLAAMASLAISRSIASPVENLARTATRIARGDLDQVAPIIRQDEIGELAHAFNSMTEQLRDLIEGLEKRVLERTQEIQDANRSLSRRAVQMETSARVSQEITSILDIDQLLARVVSLMHKAFGYYRIHIFLIESETEELVLRASSGEPAPSSRRIPIVLGSLNGEAAQSNKAVLCNDVVCDPRYMPDDMLPDTRAELVIPLRVGEHLIGTLDVQSSQVNSFTQEDLLVIQSLGDQVAVAIENARLYEQNRDLAVLEERNRLARDLHDSVTQTLYSLRLLAEGWRRIAASNGDMSVNDTMSQVGEITQQALKEMRLLVYELRPPEIEQIGFIGAIRQRLEAVEDRAGINTRLEIDDLTELPTPLEDELYRITQEALNNSLKHAAATAIHVQISKDNSQIYVKISDNGCGFNLAEMDQHRGGLGMASMRERASRLGGTLSVISHPGAGTEILVALPVNGLRVNLSQRSEENPLRQL